MTPTTLHFLRALLDRVTLQVSDSDFPTIALTTIAAIKELDEAIANANNSNGRDTPGPVEAGRAGLPVTP